MSIRTKKDDENQYKSTEYDSVHEVNDTSNNPTNLISENNPIESSTWNNSKLDRDNTFEFTFSGK